MYYYSTFTPILTTEKNVSSSKYLLICAQYVIMLVGKFCSKGCLIEIGSNMKQKITGIEINSPAALSGIHAGWKLISINGSAVFDVIDYEQLTWDKELYIELETDEEPAKTIVKRVKKEMYEPLGLNFESSLMSPVRQCANHCIFCFIDQMPHGNRKTLYFKDDDWRLSLIMGNYVTLTNVSEREFERILLRRVSPLYISVHATDGNVRKAMMRSKNAENILERLTALHKAGLKFHCQIVLCPGFNDGDILQKSLNELYLLRPECQSIAIVPVGLTRHREGLAEITPITREKACEVIAQIDKFKKERGLTDFVYASDEMYLCAEMELPSFEECGDFEQIENGVGLYRKFENDFLSCLKDIERQDGLIKLDSISGVSIAPIMQELFKKLIPLNIEITVHPVINDFFGHSVTVTGLTTARDIILQHKGKLNGRALILPHTMLRENDTVFLDGMTIGELSEALSMPVYKISADDGYDFVDDIVGIIDTLKCKQND